MIRIDWPYLRNASVTFAVTGLLATVLLWVTAHRHSTAQEAFSTQESNYTAAKRRYEEARHNRELYKQYLDKYRQLVSAGIIGEEQRLSWIEGLQNINKQFRFASLNYEIEPQAAASMPGMDIPEDIRLNVSAMKLTAGLLHEGDAVSLWEALRRQAKGFYALTGCDLVSTMNRESPVIKYTPYTSYVQLECMLDWYTIEVRSS